MTQTDKVRYKNVCTYTNVYVGTADCTHRLGNIQYLKCLRHTILELQNPDQNYMVHKNVFRNHILNLLFLPQLEKQFFEEFFCRAVHS